MDKTSSSLRNIPVFGYLARILFSVWKLPALWDDLHADSTSLQSRSRQADAELHNLHGQLASIENRLETVAARGTELLRMHETLAESQRTWAAEVGQLRDRALRLTEDVQARVVDHEAKLYELSHEINEVHAYPQIPMEVVAGIKAQIVDHDTQIFEVIRQVTELQATTQLAAPPESLRQEITELRAEIHRIKGSVEEQSPATVEAAELIVSGTPAPPQEIEFFHEDAPPRNVSQAVYVGSNQILTKLRRGGSLLCVAQDLQVTPDLVQTGEWEPGITRVLQRNLRPGMKFLDIGANIGYFTVLGARAVGDEGRVHAFEPVPETFRLLELNCALNHLHHRCELHNVALTDQAGEVTIHTFERNGASSTLSSLPERLFSEFQERPRQIQARAENLDSIYKDRTPYFDVIKIDAEGAEPLIFEGGAKFFECCVKRSAVLIIEYNPPAIQGLQRSPGQFLERLLGSGYRILRLTEPGRAEPVTRPSEIAVWDRADLLLTRSFEPVPV